jgi:hypothetical protein
MPVIPCNGIETFLKYLQAHFCLAVWTLTKPKTVKLLLKSLFPNRLASGGRLLFVWSQHQCERVEEERGAQRTEPFSQAPVKSMEDLPSLEPFQHTSYGQELVAKQMSQPSKHSASTTFTREA